MFLNQLKNLPIIEIAFIDVNAIIIIDDFRSDPKV